MKDDKVRGAIASLRKFGYGSNTTVIKTLEALFEPTFQGIKIHESNMIPPGEYRLYPWQLDAMERLRNQKFYFGMGFGNDEGTVITMMTKENEMKQHKHAAVIKAWADGAEIQVKQLDGEWSGLGTPCPSWAEHFEYRIKPEPDPYAELKAAHAAGKVIEYNYCSVGWVKLSKPAWCDPIEKYRIKPEEVVHTFGVKVDGGHSGCLDWGIDKNLRLTFLAGVLVDAEVIK